MTTQAEAASVLRALTQRQLETLILLANGASSKAAAERLGIGTETLRSHRNHIQKRLGMSMIRAAVLASKAGWA